VAVIWAHNHCLLFSGVGVGVYRQFVDTYELTRLGQQVQGRTPLVQFSRFLAGLPAQKDGDVVWSVSGVHDAPGRRFLDVRAQAKPIVQCQRCMGDMLYDLDVSSRLQVVETEAELNIDDDPESSPDDWIEPVLASRRLDVLAVVEDELVLGLPYVPMHESCSTDALEQAQQPHEDDEPVTPSPFAVLSQLKKN